MKPRTNHTIDAAGESLGRVAAKVAHLLMGKHKPSFAPHIDSGDFVRVVHLKKIKFTGNKMSQKRYYRPTRRVGALSSESLAGLWERRPQEVLRKAVAGMLPKNTLRTSMIKRLTISE